MVHKIVEGISSDELLTASESNRIAFWAAYGRAPGSSLQATSTVIWLYTGIQTPLFNGVVSIQSEPDEVKVIVDELQAKIEEDGAPALWWIGPQSKPDNLGFLLEQYGLQPAGDVPGMAIDLEMVASNLKMVENFSVQQVNNVEMQALWARTAAIGTGFSDEAIEGMVQIEASLTDPQYKAQPRYLGFLNGKAVATSVLVLDSGVAGIYAVATIPEARGRGIGRLMTELPLIEARQRGYRIGILQASSMGYSIYKRIGFEEICMYRLYLQTPKRLA